MTRLPPPVARWLQCEQHVNERIINTRVYTALSPALNGVAPEYRPETGGAWKQDFVLASTRIARAYGPVRQELRDAFGFEVPAGKVPMFVHPQSRALFAEHVRRGGLHASDIVVRPTASSRSLVASIAGYPPSVLKVGIDCRIGGRWRGFEEQQVVRAIVLSNLLDRMEPRIFSDLNLDWFRETCGGAADVPGQSQGQWDGPRTSGWLLRALPACFRRKKSTLVPLFSLLTHVDGAPSQLEDMIRASGEPALQFTVERIIGPIVRAFGHLALVEGLFGEIHPQNLLFEVGADGMLTGHLVTRDLTDMSLNLGLRLAQQRAFSLPPADLLPKNRSLQLAWVSTSAFLMEWTQRTHWASICLNGHGMQGSIWVLQRALRAAHPTVTLAALKSAYLRLWQRELLSALNIEASIQPGLAGLPFDEAIAAFLAQTNWAALGKPCAIPARTNLRRIGNGTEENRGLVVETAWGEVFIVGGVPTYFRPAF